MAVYSNNLIPLMTSNTAPSGIASSSSNNATYPAWKAFDSTVDSWLANSVTTGWLAYEFPTPQKINKYILTAQNTTRMAKTWTFEGTNDDGATWVVLDTRANITDWVVAVDKEFVFVNSVKYKKYRINVSANNGDATYLGINTLQMMEELALNKTLISLSSGEYKTYSSIENYSNDLTPIMTSNTAPFGVSSSSDIFNSTYDSWKAFDKTVSSSWLSLSSVGWLSYQFDTSKIIDKYSITARDSTVAQAPKNWTFEGSNDGSNWTVLDTKTNQTAWNVSEKRDFTFENNSEFKTYRLNITANCH